MQLTRNFQVETFSPCCGAADPDGAQVGGWRRHCHQPTAKTQGWSPYPPPTESAYVQPLPPS